MPQLSNINWNLSLLNVFYLYFLLIVSYLHLPYFISFNFLSTIPVFYRSMF